LSKGRTLVGHTCGNYLSGAHLIKYWKNEHYMTIVTSQVLNKDSVTHGKSLKTVINNFANNFNSFSDDPGNE